MASSFHSQIPAIVHVLQALAPRTVLDVGKGFGKYGFLIHEYVGIPARQRPVPSETLAAQSCVAVDAVEIQPDYLFPHLPHLYREVMQGDIRDLCDQLRGYDLVLLADVLEHIPKQSGMSILSHFLGDGSRILVSTPKRFFQQDLYGSEHEHHVSHWAPTDFRFAPYLDWQNVGPGRIYLLAPRPTPIRGFGHGPLTRARRIAAFLRDEFV